MRRAICWHWRNSSPAAPAEAMLWLGFVFAGTAVELPEGPLVVAMWRGRRRGRLDR
ncbi:hypothetical protein HRW22_21325 [Streptomyces lunaelactis]|nr:hypothetical protein [Streptomyces lunaelactis]